MNSKKMFYLSTIFSCCIPLVSAGHKTIRLGLYIKDSGIILKELMRSPINTSALTASSPWVIDEIIQNIVSGNVLEIGAGPGTVTHDLAKKLKCGDKDYRLDVVECNGEMFEELKKRVDVSNNNHLYKCFFDGHWCPMEVGDCNNFYDTIISTIPLTRLSKEIIEEILQKILVLLKPGGKFIYISLLGARFYGKAGSFVKSKIKRDPEIYEKYKDKLQFIDNWIQQNFNQNQILVVRNIPPMWVYFATKKN